MIDEKTLNPHPSVRDLREHLEWLKNVRQGHLLLPNHNSHNVCTRLVAILPTGRINEFELSHRILQLARPMSVPVLIVGLPASAECWYREHLELNRIAAIIHSFQTPARVHCSSSNNWYEAMKEIRMPGDLFVCFEQHKVRAFLWKKQPVGDWLYDTFDLPVFVIEGLGIEAYSGV